MVHEVDITLLGKIHHTFLHAECRIGKDIKVSGETKVLRIVRHERQMEALVTIHIDRIHNIILIETDTSLRYRAVKRILQETEAVLIDIDILEHILQYGSQHVTGIEKFVYPRRVQPFDDRFLIMGIFPVQLLRNRFVHRYGKNVLSRYFTHLYLITEERIFLKQI